MASLAVRYVNGEIAQAEAEQWPTLRADGVEYVDIRVDGQGYRIQGRSVYWLYRVGETWLLGGGLVGESGIEEVSAREGASPFVVRHPRYMPDLPHNAVKLGWWA